MSDQINTRPHDAKPIQESRLCCPSWIHGILGVFLICQSLGCAALLVGAAGGVAGSVYYLGKLTEDVQGSVPKVHKATLVALKTLNLPIQEERVDKIAGKVKSEFSDGKNIWIHLESKTRTMTKVEIRVGHVGEGDESRSRQILVAIKRHL